MIAIIAILIFVVFFVYKLSNFTFNLIKDFYISNSIYRTVNFIRDKYKESYKESEENKKNGSGIIKDIDKDIDKLKNKLKTDSLSSVLNKKNGSGIIRDIDKNFDKLRSNLWLDSSFLIIFSENRELLFNSDKNNDIFLEFCNSYNKNNCIDGFLLDSFADAELNKEAYSLYGKTVLYSGQTSRRNILAEVYTVSFKELNWYLSFIWPGDDNKIFFIIFVGLLFLIFLFFAICAAIVTLLVSTTIRPLEILSRRMEYLPDYDFIGGDVKELTAGLPTTKKNEIGRLAQTFVFMIDKLTANIRMLINITARAERMQSELNVARDIQLGSLPKNFSFAVEKGVELHAHLVPAREIGGDLYDFFFIDDDHVCIAVGDVADKGVPAALFMTIVKKLISSKANAGDSLLSPADIMNQMNEMLCKDNPSATFVTLFIGIFNVKNGELCYANGGHVPPLFTDGGNAPFFRKDLSGPVVGVISGISYKEIATALPIGGAVFLCTDGITEAMNENGEIFGDKRLLAEFDRMKDSSCAEIVEGIYQEVKKYAGTAPQSDDITMLMIRWRKLAEQGE